MFERILCFIYVISSKRISLVYVSEYLTAVILSVKKNIYMHFFLIRSNSILKDTETHFAEKDCYTSILRENMHILFKR